MCRFCRDLMQPGSLMSNWPIRSSVAEDIWLQTTWLPIHFVIFLPVPMVATCTYASGLRPTKQKKTWFSSAASLPGGAVQSIPMPIHGGSPVRALSIGTIGPSQPTRMWLVQGLDSCGFPPGSSRPGRRGWTRWLQSLRRRLSAKRSPPPLESSWVHVRLQVVHKISAATYASRMPRIYNGKQMNTIEIQPKSRTHVSSQMIFHSKSEEYIPVSQHLIGLTVNQLAGSWSIPLRRVDWPWSQ